MMPEITITQSQAEKLQEFVESHMEFCFESLGGMETPEDWNSYSAYCGCQTCDTREYLMATFDWLKANNIVDLYISDNVE